MSRRPIHFLSLAACLVVLSHCKKAPPAATTSPGAEPLAIVGGRSITEADLRGEAEWRIANHQPVPAPDVLLDEMVRRLALVEQARQAGLDQETETRRRLESLLIARLRELRIDAAVNEVVVSDDEVRAAYDARASEFSRKALDRFAMLFQAVPVKSSDARRAEARQRLEEGLAVIEANPAPGGRGPAASGFGAVAVDFSDDQASRYRGGDIGWVEAGSTESRVPADVLQAGRSLEKGARSEILESKDGLYVIMRSDARPGGALPLDEVADRLRHGLLLEKRRAMEERFAADALAAAKVSTRPEAARKVTLPVAKPVASPPDQPPGLPGAAPPSAAR